MKISVDLRKTRERKSSTCGSISWTRLGDHLKKSGELKDGESITHIEADSEGIRYFVRRKGK